MACGSVTEKKKMERRLLDDVVSPDYTAAAGSYSTYGAVQMRRGTACGRRDAVGSGFLLSKPQNSSYVVYTPHPLANSYTSHIRSCNTSFDCTYTDTSY
jgi:hypothetical protein